MEFSEIDSLRRSVVLWRSVGIGAIAFNCLVSVVAIIRTLDPPKQETIREVVKAEPVAPTDLIEIKDKNGKPRIQIGAIGKGAYGIAVASPDGKPSFVVANADRVATVEVSNPNSHTQFAFESDEHGGVLLTVSMAGRPKLILGVDSNGLTQLEATTLEGRKILSLPTQ